MRFTLQQTERWQWDLLATVDNLHQLVWFIQMILPPPPKSLARTMSQAERLAYRYRTACWPGDWVPYLEVAPDPRRSRSDAELLTGLFAANNPPTVTFVPALALRSELATVKHYEFGREWDVVCSRCGSVLPTTDPNALRLCADCEHRLYRRALY